MMRIGKLKFDWEDVAILSGMIIGVAFLALVLWTAIHFVHKFW